MSEKEFNIKTAMNFLLTVYGGSGDNWHAADIARLTAAEAEGDTETLIKALDAVQDFCNDLISKLKEEEK